MLGETVSFVLETPRKSSSLVSDECVVLSVLATAEESQDLMTCPRVAQNEDFCLTTLPILWLTLL